VLGANIAGSTGYPGVGTSTHRTGSSCTACHMGESEDMEEGGHTWAPSLNACTTCHDTMTAIPDGIAGFTEDLETLKGLLVAEGILLDNGRSVPGVYPVKVAQAAWNYKTVEEDQSNGLHNPGYTRALLKNSIEAIITRYF